MKKFLMFAISVALALGVGFSFVGCKDPNTLIVGTSPDFEPFEFLEKNELVGFDIDLLNEIGVKIGKKIKYQSMDFDGILAAVASGKVDLGLSGFTIDEARKKAVLFSESYIDNEQVLVVKETDTSYDNLSKEQIEEKLKTESSIRIGACKAYVGAKYAIKLRGATDNNFTDFKIQVYDDFALVAARLGVDVDVIIMDKMVALAGAKNGLKIKIMPVTLVTEQYGMAMKLGNTELKTQIDTVLEEMIESGRVDELKVKWGIEK